MKNPVAIGHAKHYQQCYPEFGQNNEQSKFSLFTAVSEYSLPASLLMHLVPEMFHLAYLVACHLLLPWRNESGIKQSIIFKRPTFITPLIVIVYKGHLNNF